ncbi:MAG: hypothetical protein B6242_02250 [Anaerolineaceae bacterium 4572_78]|nr:MAG: hypothetical protein B6242_02250 [Anaerolineaceae bacterium 4572_78]
MLKKISNLIIVLSLLGVILVGAVAAQGDIQPAAEGYFSGGTQNIQVADLFDILNDGDDSNDPFIIDARSADDYALAHIPGAANIGAKELPVALADLPTDKDIVVYCYTGQTSSQMTSALNIAGYNAKSMLFGFPAWAMVEGLKGSPPFDRAVDGHEYLIEEDANEASDADDAATPLGDSVEDALAVYFANGTKNIKSSSVFENLNDGDDSNDPFIIDLRKADDYAIGHVPGAVNIGVKTLFTAENLAKIPASRQVVIYCYSGQMQAGSTEETVEEAPAEETTEAATEEAPAEVVEEAPAEVVEEAPATLPSTGGVVFPIMWVYILAGSALVGKGVYLCHKR